MTISNWDDISSIYVNYNRGSSPKIRDFSSEYSIDNWNGSKTYGYECHINEYINHYDITPDSPIHTNESLIDRPFFNANEVAIRKFKFTDNALHPVKLRNNDDGSVIQDIISVSDSLNSDVIYQVVAKPAQEYHQITYPASELFIERTFSELSEQYRNREDSVFSISGDNILDKIYDYISKQSYPEDINWNQIADYVEEKAHHKCYEVNIRLLTFNESSKQAEQDVDKLASIIENKSDGNIQGIVSTKPSNPKYEYILTQCRQLQDTDKTEFRSPPQTPFILSEESVKSLVMHNV